MIYVAFLKIPQCIINGANNIEKHASFIITILLLIILMFVWQLEPMGGNPMMFTFDYE